MKPKRKIRKLTLNKVTVTSLNDESLNRLKGGMVTRFGATCESCDASCDPSGCGTCDPECPTIASKCVCVTDDYFCA